MRRLRLPPLMRRPIPPADTAARIAGPLATLLVALGFGWLATGLIGDFLLPRPAPVVDIERDPLRVAGQLAALNVSAPRQTAASAPANLLLAGIAASADPRLARALIRRDGQPDILVLAVGEEISAGTRVDRIERDAVLLTGPAGHSRLTLPQPAGTAPAAPDHD